jgi:hypothetical protein
MPSPSALIIGSFDPAKALVSMPMQEHAEPSPLQLLLSLRSGKWLRDQISLRYMFRCNRKRMMRHRHPKDS